MNYCSLILLLTSGLAVSNMTHLLWIYAKKLGIPQKVTYHMKIYDHTSQTVETSKTKCLQAVESTCGPQLALFFAPIGRKSFFFVSIFTLFALGLCKLINLAHSMTRRKLRYKQGWKTLFFWRKRFLGFSIGLEITIKI